MANEVVPETTWGPRSFGLADARIVTVQRRYATEQLHFPVWGLSPSSTADDSGGYGIYGVVGATFPPVSGRLASAVRRLCDRNDGDPARLVPRAGRRPPGGVRQYRALRRLYPDIYTSDGGFYDAVNPTTGSVGHRELVLDQSMIMAALDNALNHRAIQHYFASDPISWAAKLYLSSETMTIN